VRFLQYDEHGIGQLACQCATPDLVQGFVSDVRGHCLFDTRQIDHSQAPRCNRSSIGTSLVAPDPEAAQIVNVYQCIPGGCSVYGVVVGCRDWCSRRSKCERVGLTRACSLGASWESKHSSDRIDARCEPVQRVCEPSTEYASVAGGKTQAMRTVCIAD
jgi:hypothetical protein